jgi:hypothetical protein
MGDKKRSQRKQKRTNELETDQKSYPTKHVRLVINVWKGESKKNEDCRSRGPIPQASLSVWYDVILVVFLLSTTRETIQSVHSFMPFPSYPHRRRLQAGQSELFRSVLASRPSSPLYPASSAPEDQQTSRP